MASASTKKINKFALDLKNRGVYHQDLLPMIDDFAAESKDIANALYGELRGLYDLLQKEQVSPAGRKALVDTGDFLHDMSFNRMPEFNKWCDYFLNR